MGVRIVPLESEPIDFVLRRLKQQLTFQGVTWEMRRRMYFADPTQLRRAKRFQKRFKARMATLRKQIAGVQAVSSLKQARVMFWKRTGKP